MLPTALLLTALCAAPEASDVFSLPDEEFLAQARGDLAELTRYADGMAWVRGRLEERRALFNQKASNPYTPDEKALLVSGWTALHDYLFSAEVIRQRYWDYWHLPKAQKAQRAWGFLLSHGALAAELAHGLAFVDLAGSKAPLEALLDEPAPEFGLPPKAFAAFKLQVVHVSVATQLWTGDAWGHQELGSIKESGALQFPEAAAALRRLREDAKAAKDKLVRRGIKLFAKNAGDITRDTATAAVFPVQKTVARWMGATKVKREGQVLIPRELVDKVAARLEPGDILLVRRNWYLSNVGLPGFWPHAELHVGTPAALAAAFDEDLEVQRWVEAQPGGKKKLSEHLAARFPEKWKAFTGTDRYGEPVRIIEAISEGVVLSGSEHGMHADYVAALRPRLPKLAKAQAIARAFEYQGLPYDFDFDFLSDRALVCTELVFKSYAPSKESPGLKIPLVQVAGRQTLPANEFVRLFDREFGKEDRQLDFVAFVEGREKEQGALEQDAEALRHTWKRVKWDVLQR